MTHWSMNVHPGMSPIRSNSSTTVPGRADDTRTGPGMAGCSSATCPVAPRAGRRRLLTAGLALAVALVAAACSGSDQPAASGGSTSTTGGTAAGGPEVVLVTYDAFALPESAAAAFTERTGATIRVVTSGDAGAMLTKALLSPGAPEGDVLFGVDNTLATRVTAEDLLEPYTPPNAAVVPAADRPGGALDELLTPIDTAAVCVNADVGALAARGLQPPATLADLTDPRYRDLLVVPSPVTSSPGLAFLVGTVARSGGDWPAYWQSLRANGVRVRPSWDDAYQTDYSASGGDRPLVVSYATSPPAEVLFSQGALSEPKSVVVDDTCVRQVEYAGVLRGAPHPELARQLVEFMLGPDWQAALPASNFVDPVVPGTPRPPEFEQWAARPASPLDLPVDRIGAERDQWIEQWRSIME